jgi:hypothetical protein
VAKPTTLTDASALSFAEVADLLSKALQRPVRYQPASILGYIKHLRHAGLPLTQTLVQTALHVELRFGQAQAVDPTLARLLDRAPLSMADYVFESRVLWQPVAADQAAAML